MSNPSDTPRRDAAALGAAIRRFRGDRSQAELGDVLGVPQTTVSRWESGMVELSYEQVHRVEAALALRFGTIGRVAGYVDVADEHTVLKELRFDTIDEAQDGVQAAADLGFGVVLSSTWVADDGHGGASHSEEWRLRLTLELPYEDE